MGEGHLQQRLQSPPAMASFTHDHDAACGYAREGAACSPVRAARGSIPLVRLPPLRLGACRRHIARPPPAVPPSPTLSTGMVGAVLPPPP